MTLRAIYNYIQTRTLTLHRVGVFLAYPPLATKKFKNFIKFL